MTAPFDAQKLDRLLDENGVDLLLAVTKHNVQYLLGGYRYFFFAHADAIGTGRYLPIVGYVRGRPDQAFYIGAGNEAWGLEVFPVWTPSTITRSWTSIDSAMAAAEFIRKRGYTSGRLALEFSFFPADAMDTLRRELPNIEFVEAMAMLEELRAIKTQEELDYLRIGAAAIVDSMLATIQSAKPRVTEALLFQGRPDEKVTKQVAKPSDSVSSAIALAFVVHGMGLISHEAPRLQYKRIRLRSNARGRSA
jgi:Xaa-Pro aminopeptidase